MKLARNIQDYELLPEKLLGMNPYIFLDIRLINVVQKFIDRYGTTIYNDYHWGGNNDSRGFRPFDDKDGSIYSDHKFGRAADGVPKYVDVLSIHEDAIKKPTIFTNMGITMIEVASLTPTWIHKSIRHTNSSKLLFVDYKRTYTVDEYKEIMRSK